MKPFLWWVALAGLSGCVGLETLSTGTVCDTAEVSLETDYLQVAPPEVGRLIVPVPLDVTGLVTLEAVSLEGQGREQERARAWEWERRQ